MAVQRRYIGFFVVSVLMYCCECAFAETIYLKSGKIIEGKIIEKTAEYTKADIGGVTITFFKDEIEKITTSPISSEAAEERRELFINKAHGFKMELPGGWVERLDMVQADGGYITAWAKDRQDYWPSIVVAIDDITKKPWITRAIHYTKAFFEELLSRTKDNIIEAPHELEINGVRCSTIIFEMPLVNPAGERILIRTQTHHFIKEGKAITVMMQARSSEFDSYAKDFNQAINTFEFTDMAVPQEADNYYSSEEFGFWVKGPREWLQFIGEPGKDKYVVSYQKDREKEFPLMGITVDRLSAQQKTALDFLIQIAQTYQDNVSGRIIEPPKEMPPITEGTSAAMFVGERSRGSSDTQSALQTLQFVFVKDANAISLLCTDASKDFSSHSEAFKQFTRSFRMASPGATLHRMDEISRLSGTMQGRLKDWLATGEKREGSYKNERPNFSIEIPDGLRQRWHFVVFKEPRAPFYIVTEDTVNSGMPFISSSIGHLPADSVGKSKEELFQTIAVAHEQWEKEAWKEDYKIINKGTPFALSGLGGFERVVENPGGNTAVHIVYIFVDDQLLQFGLNTKTSEFEKDDKDFVSIIKTLAITSK